MRTRSFITAIGVLLALALTSPAAAATGDEPHAASATDLAGFLRDTAELTTRIASVDASGAAALAANVPDTWHVRHGNDEVAITTEWITAPLRQAVARPAEWTNTRTTLLARLEAMRAEAADLDAADGNAGGPPALDPAAARATLGDLLARSEFRHRGETQSGDALTSWLRRMIERLLDRLAMSRTSTTAVSRVFAWIVAGSALVLLVVYLFRARLPQRNPKLLAIEAPRASSAEWAARAYDALRAGAAREAMHCGYHAVLFRLEEQGVWRVDDSRTPREYVSLLPVQDARREAFIDLTRRFEQTWYGSRAADGPGLLNHLEAFGCAAPSRPAM